MIKKDFFYKASGLFLTENLTPIEFDDILSKGDILPVCSDYEGWDSDYLEEKIGEVASELELCYNEGVAESKSLSDFIPSFISLAKQVSLKCSLKPDVYKSDGFTDLFDKHINLIGRVYFNDHHKTWSLAINGIEYANYSGNMEIPSNNTDASMKLALDILADFNENFEKGIEPLKRKFPSINN